MPDQAPDPQSETGSPMSLDRLQAAFAEMLGHEDRTPVNDVSDCASSVECGFKPDEDASEVTPRSIVEALLFVGHPQNKALSARELAAAMRGVSPQEVAEAVDQLNVAYRQDPAPYEISKSSDGYRLVLREEFSRMRDKFYGKVREARLSQAAVDVLSIVAYHQPATAEQIDALRGAPCHAVLATLVRRKLVRLERRPEQPRKPMYCTTDRFLRLFGLERLEELPRPAECETA